MELSGSIAQSVAMYDVKIDENLDLSVGVKLPLAALLDQAVAKLNSPVASEVEKALVSAIKLYLAAQPK